MTPDYTTSALASGAPLLLTVAGIVIVVVLIGCFWWGSGRDSRKPQPPQEPQSRAGSWDTPDRDGPSGSGA